MKINFEEDFKYINQGLLKSINLKIYSDDKINILIIANDFFEQEGLECYQFTIDFKELKQANSIKKMPGNNWTMYCNGEYDGVLFEKSVMGDRYLINLVKQLISEIVQKDAGYQFIIQSLNIQILISLLRIIKENFQKSNRIIQAEKTLNYIFARYSEYFLQNDVLRNFNHKYSYTEINNSRKEKIIDGYDRKRKPNKLKLNNMYYKELFFKIKFRNDNYVNFHKFIEEPGNQS